VLTSTVVWAIPNVLPINTKATIIICFIISVLSKVLKLGSKIEYEIVLYKEELLFRQKCPVFALKYPFSLTS